MPTEFVYFSKDGRFMAVSEIVLYAYTHTNEDGVKQYQIVGIANTDEDADLFLEGKPAKYTRVRKERGGQL